MSTTTPTHDFGRFAPDDWHLCEEYARIFGGFWAEHRHTAITHDTIIKPDGTVRIEVNGYALGEL
jgi:hypothetical protein